MAEQTNTGGGENPFLKALKEYQKDSTVPQDEKPVTGPVSPFSGLKKKEPTTHGSPSGAPSSKSGSNPSQASQTNSLFDPNVVKELTQQHQQKLQQTQDPNSQYYQDRAAQRVKEENTGSWENTLPHVAHALTQMITKPIAGTAKVTRDLISTFSSNNTNADKPLYDANGNLTQYGKQVDAGQQSDPLGKLIIGLDAYNNNTDKEDVQKSLPHTFLGNTAQGLINVAPDLITTAALPEEKAAEAMSPLMKLKQALWNPFTKVMAAKGGLNAYSHAEQQGATKGEAAIEGGKGVLQGAKEGAEAGVLGGVAGKISETAAKGLSDLGIIKNGKLTKAGLDAASDAAVFGAYPVASNLLQGKPINKDEIEQGVGTGLAFGLLKAKHTYDEHAPSDAHINEVLSDRQASAIQNFMNASPDAIEEAYNMPDHAGDINAKAIEYAHKAVQEPDADKKNQFAVVASTLAKASDVKGTVEAILQNRQGFIDNIANSELPDEVKGHIIDKINTIYKQVDPVEKAKTDLGQQIQQIDEQVKQVQPIAEQSQDPVQQTEAEVKIERLNKAKEDLRKKLKETINAQHDNVQQEQGIENTPTEEPVLPNEKQAEATPANENVGDNIKDEFTPEERKNLIHTGKMQAMTGSADDSSPLNYDENTFLKNTLSQFDELSSKDKTKFRKDLQNKIDNNELTSAWNVNTVKTAKEFLKLTNPDIAAQHQIEIQNTNPERLDNIISKEELNNAIQQQSTGEMGVRQQDAVGEGMGRQDESKQSAGESTNEQVQSPAKKEIIIDKKIPRKRKASAYAERINKISEQTPRNLREAILDFFVRGGKLSSDDFTRYTGFNMGKDGRNYISLLKKPLGGVERSNGGLPLDFIAEHHIPEEFHRNSQGVENEIINTLLESGGSRNKMLAELEKSYGVGGKDELSDEEKYAYGHLTDAEREIVDKHRNGQITDDELARLLNKTELLNQADDHINDQTLTEHHINELADLLDKYTDEKGNINWGQIEKEFDNFGYGDLLNVATIKKNEKSEANSTNGDQGLNKSAEGAIGVKDDGSEKNSRKLTDSQKVISDSYDNRITDLKEKITSVRKRIESKLDEVSKKNNLFGDEQIGKTQGQVAAFNLPMDLTDENMKSSVMRPLVEEHARLQKELSDTIRQKEIAISNDEKQRKLLPFDNEPQFHELPPKEIEDINKSIKELGITYDDIKAYEDYERSRERPSGISEGNGQEPASVSEDVRQSGDDTGASENKNIEGEGLRQQPQEQENRPLTKEEQLRQKIDEAKANLSDKLKKSRGKLNSGLPIDAESLKAGVELVKAYADLGIHKFSEIIKDWIGDNKDVDENEIQAIKAAYAAHVANLDSKDRKPYDDLKELDRFMKKDLPVITGKIDKASLPDYSRSTEPRLPTPEAEATEPPNLKEKYSQISKLKSYAIRNLEQLKAFSKDINDFDAYREVRKFATSKSQASVILKTATKGILDLVGKDGWKVLRESLVESRLRGIKARWEKYADQVSGYDDNEIKTMFDDGKQGDMYNLIHNLAPLDGEQNPADFAVSLISGGRYEDTRNYLANVFYKAADNVLSLGKLSNGQTFDEMVQDGKFKDEKMQKALDVYKKLLEKPIAESHESNEGIFSDDLGDLDTYYPLTGQTENKPRLLSKGKPFNIPNNINNKFATGQSDRYSTEISDLSDKLTSAIKVNNKANALEALKKVGLIVDVPHNAPDTEKMQVGDELYDFVKEKVAESRTIINDGNIAHTQSKYVMMPKWLKAELDPIFNSTDEYDRYTAIGKMMNVLTKVALGGPTEAISHSYRLLGVLTNSVPFMNEWAYKNGVLGETGGYVANNPFVKKWTGLFKILGTDISSDKALNTIQEMSKLGIIPEKTWTKTWSREFAELTGANASRIKVGKLDIPNITDFSPILYGKNSIDLKSRVLMYNLTKAMNPEATPEEIVKMQNELGVYTKALQSKVERKIKENGFAPYYTFGSSIYRTALKSVFGSNPVPIERPSFKDLMTKEGVAQGGKLARYKAAQMLTNGVVGTVASWALIYHSQTGHWPWEDETSKLGRLPFPEWAKNDLTAKYFTDANGDYKDFNMWAINNPVVERGMRVIGAEKAYETKMLGGTNGQSIEAGATQALNTAISPFTSSPVVQFATTAGFGSAPYITGLRDDKGKPAPQFFKKVKATPFGVQNIANIYAGFKEINPLVDLAVTQTNKYTGLEKSLFGLNSVTNPDTQNEGASALGYILNMAFPRFFVPHGNDDAKAHFIEKAQTDLDKTLEKQSDKENE